MTSEQLPAYSDLILPTVRAVIALGGSATAREVTSQVLSDLAPTEDMLAVTQPNRPESSVLMERIQWARSYAKLIGALESPKRGVFLVTALGRELAALPREEGSRRTLALDREYRRNRPKRARERTAEPAPADPEEAEAQAAEAEEEESLFTLETTGSEPERWQDVLLARLHRLSPDAFEEFVLYLLRLYGLQLERVGGSGDEGIDGIGTAPISPVLSSRVAVQVKRFDPNGRAVSREVVALFQRDAQTKGAERAILVTLGKFSEPARKAAIVTSPTVDLIDGERLADLVKEQRLGVRSVTRVDPAWFDRFDSPTPKPLSNRAV
ncbi:hypothetical protein GCM10009721_06200 [Terrabacter tumescens]|uniref:Restriction endonuclease n=1 Tax=Terrabacter tumescens TaxID=60443 RepID=A0ABQ2HKC3_9MICO|nr:restriction endonuclease [Terrabacter tumescens]GGM84229.1 hypothetical protein GCM10009721_06200 [Terrabacter tumescens]